MNIYFSPLNTINFTEKPDENSGELSRMYVQQFIHGDLISLQVASEENISVRFNIKNTTYPTQSKELGGIIIYYVNISTSNLPKDELLTIKCIIVKDGNITTLNGANMIELVENCEELKLIQYTNNSNISPFNTFFDGFKFSLRLPVGFKSSSLKNRLVNETFRNQNQELKLLYSYPYETKTLIIGDGLGVPNYMARLINSIFCLSDVTIDGIKYVRSDDSVPEKTGGIDGYPLHIYQMEVEEIKGSTDINIENISKEFNEDFE